MGDLLAALILIPLVGGGVAALAGRASDAAARLASLATALLTLASAIVVAVGWRAAGGGETLLELRLAWIPRFGIEFHLGLDGLAVVFVLLTALLGLMAVLAAWRDVERDIGLHHLCILSTVAGIMGVFLAWDLFLFYFFWELMLVPMYFLIGVWGHERRVAAAVKFFIFTMVSGLLLLVAILGLYFAHGAATGQYTMDYARLLGTQIPVATARWLFLGFVAAFAVKLPLFPLHSWLPDAHTEAPVAGSILLAGLLLKTGGYGLIRFAWPLFPDAARSLSGPLALLGAVGIIYGGVLAFSQRDMKRLIAYTSVSHMGFVILGIAAWRLDALQGAVVQMLAHGVATGALFAVAGMVHERLHTRELDELGGLWARIPRLSAFALLFVLASVGLPGLGNFVGEFMVLVGSFPVSPRLVVVGVAGIVVGTVALLAMMQRAFFGALSTAGGISLADLGVRETVLLAALAVASVVIGLWPAPALDAVQAPLQRLMALDLQFNPVDPDSPDSDRIIVEVPSPRGYR